MTDGVQEFDIGTDVWYYRHDLPNRTQPRAAKITAPGSNPESFDIQVYMSHTLDVQKGSPPILSRPSVPFRLAFPEDGSFPFEAFVCPAGVRWKAKVEAPAPQPNQPAKPASVLSTAAILGIKPDGNAPMTKLMGHPAWARSFDEFKGTVSDEGGTLKIASTKGQLLAQISFGEKGYLLKVFKDADTLGDSGQPTNDPRGVSKLIVEAGKVAMTRQDAANAHEAAGLVTA